MLSRTADHLFWMARYVERAENTARMLDVNLSTSLLPQTAESAERAWRAMLSISELQAVFDARHRSLKPQSVLDFMVREPDNPSSIFSCLQAARENARAVRGTLTTEVWETYNDTWLALQKRLSEGALERDPQELFEWVKYRSHLSRGVLIGTMLKDEAFYFTRLGTFLERADNTARIVDVKFHGASGASQVMTAALVNGVNGGVGGGTTGAMSMGIAGGKMTSAMSGGTGNGLNAEMGGGDHHFDFYYWAAILRSVSAFEIYRKVYRDVITPARVAELMILRDDMPRSLVASINEVWMNLEQVKNDRSRETQRRAGLLRAELQFGRIDDILQQGLHAYLTSFLERVNDIGGRISADFLVPLAHD